ncbi:MAG: 30S ribosomal protein S21 [Candidatus Pacebacteria bacterium]|jgi:small subunit ribosomal protein S21|nr:30S ribosomal protein S21 [Candidatus Paceibacterota bacterium]|tara:strand:+ start:636 stop:866 length:231 start_codon:yes stop_codon:yes gene_type:complete
MISIKIRPNENINRALSRFKSAVLNEGIIKTVNDKSHFIKPSLKRKLKREAAQRQRMKDELKLIRQIENEQKEWRK